MKVPEKLLKALDQAESILIMAHQHPDGDAVGSVSGLGRSLKLAGKHVDYFMDTDSIEEKLSYIEELPYFTNKEKDLKDSYDAIVYCDTSTLDYAYQPEKLPKAATTLLIDHHKSNVGFCDVDFIVITGATGELVYEVIEQLGLPVDNAVKESIFTALTTDTGSFQFNNTVPHTHQVAAKLHEDGKSFSLLSKRLHTEKTLDQLKIYAKAVDSLELFADEEAAVFYLDFDSISRFGGSLNITDDISNIGMNIPSIKISALIKEISPGQFRISIRSKGGSSYDASKIAIANGGGGHMNAAGCSAQGELEDVVKELKASIQREIDEVKA